MAGDAERAAFEEAFDLLWPRVLRVALRTVGDEKAAEDVAAETFTRTWLHWRRVSALPWRDGWILKVAANLALREATRRPGPLLVAEPTGVAEDELVVVRAALVAALSKLSRRQRQVVVLRHLAGLDEAEVAAALRITPGSVKTHLSRGLAHLRRTDGPDLEDALHALRP